MVIQPQAAQEITRCGFVMIYASMTFSATCFYLGIRGMLSSFNDSITQK